MTSSTATYRGTMKRWKTDMIESHGDYRAEAFLEKYIGGPLYEHQHELPRLHVPTLDETIGRFLPSALPLAKTEDEKMRLLKDCQAFQEQAKILQQRLIKRKEGDMKDSSYLQLWWNQLGYLQVRDPVVVNVSYFLSFTDDPTIDATGSKANIQRGAAILYATAEFRKLVCTGQLQPERVGKKKTLIDATAYKYMFNACRIPHAGQDSYRIYDPSRNTHCIIVRKGHFFSIELVRPDGSGDPLPLSVLEGQLQQCIVMADRIPSTRPKLGLMTSGNRDDWANGREALLRTGGISMNDALRRLESGAILLNLDDETPIARQELGELYWTGGLKSGENRWFDKSIQIMVPNNGKAGLIAEHSMMDGMPVVNYANYITNATYGSVKHRSRVQKPFSSDGRVEDIFETVMTGPIDTSTVESLQMNAWKAFSKLITDHSLHVQSFHGYGSTFMKQNKFAPDAFVQIAMQVATYRLFGEQVGTYEATQVRSFLHGRTEVTRAVSAASESFVKTMGFRPKMDEMDPMRRTEKLQLLRKAVTTHSKNAGLAANSRGVDRHFLGLSLLVENNEMPPDLFSNPVFVRSKRWRASTSNLTHPRLNLWGYGEVVPDGVGLSYAVLPRCVVFNITALKQTGYTNTLAELLEEALLELQRIVEMDTSATVTRSKL